MDPSTPSISTSTSTSTSTTSTPSTPPSTSNPGPVPALKSLILDAAPLLTQQPSLSEPVLATQYYIPPLVVEELKDERSRQYYQSLKTKGVEIIVMEPPIEALAKVIAFSKKTGDYAVLSPPDLSVLALAYSIEVKAHGTWRIRDEVGGPTGQQKHEAERLRQKKASEASSAPTSSQTETASTSQISLDSAIESIHPSNETKIEAVQTQEQNEDDLTENDEDFEDAPEIDEINLNKLSLNQKDDSDIPSVSSTSEAKNQNQLLSQSQRDDDEVEGIEEEEELDSEDDEVNGGEWITSENLSEHQAKSLGLVPAEESSPQEMVGISQQNNLTKDSNGSNNQVEEEELEEGWEVPKSKKSSSNSNSKTPSTFGSHSGINKSSKKKGNKSNKTDIATLTADYAVQNVLLQMGLGLVGAGGMRIKSVRSWVLRCHGCYKICKDSSRKFCPTCGNPTLLRTSVTSRDPTSSKIPTGPGSLSAASAGVDLHLQKNFVYHNRGTKFSLPKPKAGSSSQRHGVNKVPILREDQSEWIKAVQREKVRQGKEDRALQKAVEKSDKRSKEAKELGKEGETVSPFGLRYEDPDWMPEMLLGGKSSKNQGGLPKLGIGRKNPNERRRPKK